MKRINIKEIAKAIKGEIMLEQNHKNDFVEDVCIDSRKVSKDDLFFALIGEKQDGHIYLNDVILSGCHTIIVSHDRGLDKKLMEEKGIGLIIVSDTTKALQDLAAYYIKDLSVKKIGVTGSVGKTTTKEMLYYIFSEKYKTFRNSGNFNNHIGLPLSVLAMDESTEIGIFEMGMGKIGEIDLLAQIVKPHIGIITTIGTSHIENFESREGILKAKLEITNNFGKENTLIINSDNDLLSIEQEGAPYKTVKVGMKGKNEFIISNIIDNGEIGIDFSLENKGVLEHFSLKIPGRHNAYNSALAVAASLQEGMCVKEAKNGLMKMKLTDKRLSIKGKSGVKIIDDTYNASPESMKAAIDVLDSTKGLRKIAILGDMLGIGERSDEFHMEIGEYVGKSKVDLLFCVGEAAKQIEKGASSFINNDNIVHSKTKEAIFDKILNTVSVGDVILVKGSRDMEMDIIVRKIMERE